MQRLIGVLALALACAVGASTAVAARACDPATGACVLLLIELTLWKRRSGRVSMAT